MKSDTIAEVTMNEGTICSPLFAFEGRGACCLEYVIHLALCPLQLAFLVLREELGACPPHDHGQEALFVIADVLRRVLHTQDGSIITT